MQYTIKSVPSSTDRVLKKKAKELGLSLNAMLLSLLKKETLSDDVFRRQKREMIT